MPVLRLCSCAGIGSGHDGEFRALEYSHTGIKVWSDATFPGYGNHSARAGLIYIDKHTQPDPGERAWCLDGLMKDYYGSLQPLTIVPSLRINPDHLSGLRILR